MGIRGHFNNTCVTNNSPEAIPANPNPNNYNCISVITFNNAFVLKVRYKNCTAYEGLKVILYKGKFNPLMLKAPLDPHFRETQGDFPKPFARFEPTDVGINSALRLAHLL